MRTDKTASHIYYELEHDVQEYAKRLLAKKILHAAQQNNAAPLSDKTAKKTAETAVFLTERLALLYELNSGFRGIRFSTFGEQPAVYTTMVQHNAPLYDELMLGRAYNLANYLTRRIAYSYGSFANDQLRRLQMGLLRNRVSPEALKNKFEKRSLERAIAGWGKDNIFEITISEDADEEGKHPLLISGSLNDYPLN